MRRVLLVGRRILTVTAPGRPLPSLSRQPCLLSTQQARVSSQSLSPRLQAWLDRKSPVELSTTGAAAANLKQQRDSLLDEMTRKDKYWLSGVVNEIKNETPVGSMPEEVRQFCHTLMRWLRTRGDSAHVVEDLLLRLIEEEDSGTSPRVRSILFSLTIDAWVKEKHCKEAPQRAEALLQLMQDRYEQNSTRPPPSGYHLSQVLAAWANSSLPHAPQRAEQLLQWMEDGSNRFSTNAHAYTSVIDAYAEHGRAEDAERILRSLEARLEEDPKGAVRPNVVTYTAVIKAWANADQGLHGANMAERARERMEHWHRALNDKNLRPNVKMFTALMHVWAKSDSPDRGMKTEQLMEELLDLTASLSETDRKDPSNELTFFPFNALMDAWSKSGHPEKAENILNDMLDQVDQGGENAVAPNLYSWSIVAHGWARKGKTKQIERILKMMQERYNAGDVSAKPDTVVYNALLLALSRHRGSGPKAKRILDWMEAQAGKGMSEYHPNEISYGLVITCWRNGSDEKASKVVLELLERMEYNLKRSKASISTLPSFAYEEALATVRKGTADNTHMEVLKLLQRIEGLHQDGSIGPVLTNGCYHIALASCAWSPSRNGEVLAEDILHRMEASTNPEFNPRRRSYEAAIIAWARSSNEQAPARVASILQRLEDRAQLGESDYKVSGKTYNFALSACLNNTSQVAHETALNILQKMKEENRKGHNSNLPNKNIFRRVFEDQFEHRDSVTGVALEDMILSMDESFEQNEGDSRFKLACYLYAFTVWAWSTSRDSVAHAERLWQQMNQSTDVSPCVKCFNAVLRAYANNGPDKTIPRKADEMLSKMERDYASGSLKWRPNSASYDLVIDIWAKSALDGAPERAFDLLKHMDTSAGHVPPTQNTYADVLLACALTPARDDATKLQHFNIAVGVFNHLRESRYCEPDAIIFNRLLMCAIYLAPDKEARAKMTKHVFSLCCKHGLVDDRILKHYWEVAPLEERRQLLAQDGDEVKLSELPKEWSINVGTNRSSSM